MFEELLISVLFIIVLIILCIISNLYSKKEEEKYIMLRNSIKEDLKENFISEEEYWQYNKEYSDKIKKIKEDIQLYEEEKETIKNNDTDWMNIFKKKEKINELNRLLIDELIEDIVIEKDNNLKIIFKCEDKYFEALDFINKQNYDIISYHSFLKISFFLNVKIDSSKNLLSS